MTLYVNQRKRQNFYGFRKFTHIIFLKNFSEKAWWIRRFYYIKTNRNKLCVVQDYRMMFQDNFIAK